MEGDTVLIHTTEEDLVCKNVDPRGRIPVLC